MASKKSKGQIQERLMALQDISVELMTSRHLRDTLALIVNKAVDLLICDAGSFYLKQDDSSLVFEVAVNRSTNFNFERHTVPVSSKSLAAHAFLTSLPLRIDDVYELPESAPYKFDNSFDKQAGYRTRSVLIQPLKSSKGDVLGVLQLINRKRKKTEKWPSENAELIDKMPAFDTDDERLLQSFAAVSSAAIESSQLHKSIERLFADFVSASIHAIESRDSVTRGHSDRVAILTVDLAEKVSASNDAAIRDIKFNSAQISEIRYASLLHDFGKIGVKESTLQKEEKLSPLQQVRIRSRFDHFKMAAENRTLRAYFEQLVKEQRAPNVFEWNKLEKEIKEFGLQIENYWHLVLDLNKPTVLSKDKSAKLSEVSHVHCKNCDGHEKSLLEEDEIFSLKIQKGSLTDDERLEIESHVTHTFEFLKKIPWTKDLAGIPAIAHAHHERLDGSGYPRRIQSESIPVQSKIMAICDVFDALAANDRPYKPALPTTRALEILEMESKQGKLDPRFLKVFIEAKIYEHPQFVELQLPTIKKAA